MAAKTSKDTGIWPDSCLHLRPFVPVSFHFIVLGDVNENQGLGYHRSTVYIMENCNLEAWKISIECL